MESIRERVAEYGEELVVYEGFDSAIIGVGAQHPGGPFVIYDRMKCIRILMDRDKMTLEDATEYFAYNYENSYVGKHTPILVDVFDSEEDEWPESTEPC